MRKRLLFISLSFLMLLSALYFQGTAVFAGPKGGLYMKGKKKNFKNKTITMYVGKKDINLYYVINKKKKGVKGKWDSTNKKVVTVTKSGKCKAVGNGTATVRYIFKQGKKKYGLSCKIKVNTKTESVELRDVISEMDDVSMGINTERDFEAILRPSEEALEVNSEIEPNDHKVLSYALFEDEECTKPTELGAVSQGGKVRAYGYGGTMYLRAESRPKAGSKSVIYSNVATIKIVGLTKEEKRLEEEKQRLEAERQKKEAEEKAKQDRLRPARIEIMTQAPLDSSNPNLGLLPPVKEKISQIKVNVGFKVFDGNGKDITFATGSAIGTMSGKFRWNEQDIPVIIQTSGKAQLLLNNAERTQIINNRAITIPTQILYSRGNLTITYSQTGYPDLTTTSEVTIVPKTIIQRIEVKGIYKMDVQKQDYIPVLEGNTATIKKDDVIKTSGGSTLFNGLPESYYLLLKATDIYNNNVVGDGVKAEEIKLVLAGSTGIELDSVTGIGENIAVPQSTKSVVVDGVPYLTFPLKPATVKEGELIISANGLVQPYKKIISDGSSMLFFFLSGGVKNNGGRALVGKENILDYQLITTTGKSETNYEKVLSFLKLSNIGNTSMIQLPPNSDIISGNKFGIFQIRKDTNGNAEIVYRPQMNALKLNPNNPQMPFSPGIEEITVLKGWGTNLEKKVEIWVSQESK